MGVGIQIDHLGYGFHYNIEVHKKRVFLDIDEIIVRSLSHVIHVVCTPSISFNLGKTRNSRFYCVSVEKIVKCGIPVGTLINRVGSWANKAHIPF